MSAELLDYQPLGVASIQTGDKSNDAMQRILLYAQDPRRRLELKEVRSIFNDFQIILSDLCLCGGKVPYGIWDSNVETDIMGVRNLMNLTHSLTVSRECGGMRLCNTSDSI
jgi:hypothetical protein